MPEPVFGGSGRALAGGTLARRPWSFLGLLDAIRIGFMMAVAEMRTHRLRSLLSKPRGADLVVLKELIEAGKVTPVIDRAFPLSETAEAIGYVGERSTQGKTVITV